MIIPKPRFWWLFSIGILVALGGAVSPGLEKWVIVYDFLLIGALALSIKLTLPKKRFEVIRSTPSVLSVRTENEIRLTVINRSGTKVSGQLRDELSENLFSKNHQQIFELENGDSHEMIYHVTPIERGEGIFHGLFMRINGFLGLYEFQFRVSEPETFSIYPNVKAVKEFDFLNNRGRLTQIGVRRTRYKGVGTDFESLREFQDGDDTRRIDWKSSARRNKIVVKDYEVERNQTVVIAIDTGRSMAADAGKATKLDHVLDAALLVNNAVSKAGDLCGLTCFDAKIISNLSPRKGRTQNQNIVRTLHDQLPSGLESEFRVLANQITRYQKKRSLIVLFTEIDTPEKAQRFVDSIRGLRHTHLWFVASVIDEELNQLLNQPLRNLASFYDTAALIEAQEKRTLARKILLKNNISFTEAEPQDLAVILIQKYFKAKQQGKLAN